MRTHGLRRQPGERQSAILRPVKDERVYAPGFRGITAPLRRRRRARRRGVDGFAVRPHPLAHLAQARHAFGGDLPLWCGAHIEQEIASLRRGIDHRAKQRARVLPAIVIGLEAPRVIHRHAGFPVHAWEPSRRYQLLRRTEVTHSRAGCGKTVEPLTRMADAVVDDEAWLEGVQPVVEGAALFVTPVRDPLAVKPQHVDIRVLREQLLELRLHVRLDVTGKVRILPRARVVLRRVRGLSIRMVPVHDRVIHAEAHALALRGARQRLDNVAVIGRRIDHVVVRHLRVEQREPVVVLGRDDDVLHPRILRGAHPFVRIVLHGIEGAHELLVFVHGHLRVAHDPLANARDALAVIAAGGDGVRAPVDEHPELGVTPPAHAGVALTCGFSDNSLRRNA